MRTVTRSKRPRPKPRRRAGEKTTPDLTHEPPPPKTDDPARDKTEIKDGVIQPLPAAD